MSVYIGPWLFIVVYSGLQGLSLNKGFDENAGLIPKGFDENAGLLPKGFDENAGLIRETFENAGLIRQGFDNEPI